MAPNMAVETKRLELPPTREGDVLDITPDVQRAVSSSEIVDGAALIFVTGSTGSLSTIEYEPGLVEDINAAMERLAPKNARYGHEERWHDGNGHSHVRATIMGPDITIPITGGKLELGTWQQIVFLELDNKPRNRKITIKLMGLVGARPGGDEK